MKLFVKILLIFGFFAGTIQDIMKEENCSCCRFNKLENINNYISPFLGNKHSAEKLDCNICKQRKEMLLKEKEKQRLLQKCPFEILGSSSLKGKNSEEIFDEFRELIAPSQNGFFDLMRGIVKTMHVSSEADLRWAKEKEAKLMAKNEYEKQQDKEKREASKISFCINRRNCNNKFPRLSEFSEYATTPLFKKFINSENSNMKKIKKNRK